jgi:hypothetical protein
VPFVTQLEYETLSYDRLWRLTAPLVYEFSASDLMGEYELDHRIIVPAGYVTDFLSLPDVGRVFFDNDGPGKAASVVHDYGFTHLHDIYTRRQVDHVFKLALRDDPEQPSWLARTIFYRAVRMCGEKWWDRRIESRRALRRSLGYSCVTCADDIAHS